jgi:histidine ammonia-lyase
VITLAGHGDLSREAVEAVAWGGQRLELAPAAVERVAAGQAELAALLAGGTRVYGVSTGMGWLASVDLDPAAQEGHQRNLLLGRAVGEPPWLAVGEARALLVARLGNLLSGHAGVGPDWSCERTVGPGRGAALAERGALPHRLRAKEGVALLAGSPLATALALARLRSAERLAGQLLASAAAAVDALQAPLDPYDEAIGRLAGDPLLTEVLADLRRAAGGRAAGAAGLQAPVSFRVAPQALALVGGRALAGGGFHAVGLAAGMDAATVALAQAAELAGQRLHRLLDGRFSGLPDQLSPDPGPVTGLVVVHKRAVGALHEARRLAAPASVGQAETSLGQEDAASFAPEAAEQLRRVERLTREVVACELLAARQAWWLRGRVGRWDGPAAGLRPLAACLEQLVAPVDRDRPLGQDLDRLIGTLERDELPLP